jgi:hypothetical protein
MMRAVVLHISSVPISSSLRTEESEVFSIFGALQVLHDMYLVSGASEEGEVDSWVGFRSRTQPVTLALGMKLDEEGYGFEFNNWKSEQAQKDIGSGQESTNDSSCPISCLARTCLCACIIDNSIVIPF